MNDKILTKHQQRMANVRRRLNRVVKTLDAPNGRGRGQTDGFTTFAMKMAEVASDKGVILSRQRAELAGGTPKDLPGSLRRFGKGKVGLVSTRLDLIEATCELYEAAQTAAEAAGAVETPAPPLTVGPVVPKAEEPPQERTEASKGYYPPDPELVAMAIVLDALRGVEGRFARQRVVDWVLDRLDAEEVVNG